MKLDTFFTPAELHGAEAAARIVVIDVLRASSTMIEALHNGARAIFPVATAEDAATLTQSLGRDSALLCGERNGLPIEGFDLGNAPAEFTRDRVADRSLIMTTTNGTRAFLKAAEQSNASDGVDRILAGSFLNLGAVVERLRGTDGTVALLCAGREGRFALEDAHCAGAIIRGLESAGEALELNDAAVVARRLATEAGELVGTLEATAAGRHLAGIDRAEDVAFCARIDRSDRIPVLRERKITVE